MRGPVAVTRVRVIAATRQKSIVELVIHEGRNRIVRRLLDRVGHPVRKLTRTELGPVDLGQLKAGQLRDLTLDELGALYRAQSAGGDEGRCAHAEFDDAFGPGFVNMVGEQRQETGVRLPAAEIGQDVIGETELLIELSPDRL